MSERKECRHVDPGGNADVKYARALAEAGLIEPVHRSILVLANDRAWRRQVVQ
jgi:hypothetical protein